MPEKVMPGPVQDTACIRETVCIHTEKIYDSYEGKDCVKGLRSHPTQNYQVVIDRAINIRAGKAELLYVRIDVEPIGLNRDSHTVNVHCYYRVTVDAFVGTARPVGIRGLCVFGKRVILFGSKGIAKVLSPEMAFEGMDEQNIGRTNLPTAVVEVVDPIVPNMKLVNVCEYRLCDCELTEIPPCICACFNCGLCLGNDGKRIYVTLDQSSIIRLERDSQSLTSVYDYRMPEKECTCGGCEDDPCEIFHRVKFPVNKLFPSGSPVPISKAYRELKGCCG